MLVGFSICEGGNGLSKLAFGLIERSLERPWVDFKQELALLDERSFLVVLPHQIASHLSPDVGVRETVERADMFDIDLHILLLDRRDLDLRRAGRAPDTCFGCTAPMTRPMTNKQKAPAIQYLYFERRFMGHTSFLIRQPELACSLRQWGTASALAHAAAWPFAASRSSSSARIVTPRLQACTPCTTPSFRTSMISSTVAPALNAFLMWCCVPGP